LDMAVMFTLLMKRIELVKNGLNNLKINKL
jgi:hypothetical protein